MKGDFSVAHEQPHFTESGQEFFFDLSGHAGLFSALSGRGMRVGLGRECAVNIRSFVKAKTAPENA